MSFSVCLSHISFGQYCPINIIKTEEFEKKDIKGNWPYRGGESTAVNCVFPVDVM